MTSLKKQTVSGIKWLVGSSFLQKAIQLGATVVLARILGPAQFGLFALAFVAIDALGLFKSMGFDTALIRRTDDIEKAANTAFFIIPSLGIVLYIILAISAPWVGKFMNNLEVVGVIRALGIIFVISCLGRVPAALLERSMRFRYVSIIEVSSAILYAVSAIAMALLKMGVWSLVYAYILKTINQNILTFIFAKWRPRFQFDRKIAAEMFHFGKFIFLGSVVWFLKMNLDNVLVGKLLGMTALGLYAIAFNVANFSADYFGIKIFRVTYPAFSKLQNNLYNLKSAYLKVLKHISLIAIPFGMGIFAVGGELLRFVYGDKWLGAATALRILAIAGIFNTLPMGIGNVFLACGKPQLTFWIASVQVVIFFIFIYPLAKLYGIAGVGLVVSISSFTAFIIMLILASRVFKMTLQEFLINIKTSIISSTIMIFAIFLTKYFIFQYGNHVLIRFNFIVLSTIGIGIFCLSVYLNDKKTFNDIKELVSL